MKFSLKKLKRLNKKIDELNNNYKEHSQLVSDSAKRYAELAQGIDQLSGKNLSLNEDDYKEFLDLSNQLAEAFPTLVTYIPPSLFFITKVFFFVVISIHRIMLYQ